MARFPREKRLARLMHSKRASEINAMSTPAKFIILHLACTARRPRTWRFHAVGVLREFKRLEAGVKRMVSFIVGLF